MNFRYTEKLKPILQYVKENFLMKIKIIKESFSIRISAWLCCGDRVGVCACMLVTRRMGEARIQQYY